MVTNTEELVKLDHVAKKYDEWKTGCHQKNYDSFIRLLYESCTEHEYAYTAR